jgi:hypothetical protein
MSKLERFALAHFDAVVDREISRFERRLRAKGCSDAVVEHFVYLAMVEACACRNRFVTFYLPQLLSMAEVQR